MNQEIILDMLHIKDLVTEFHKKYGIGISIRSQQEMYQRCSLLLEEIAEMIIAIEENSNTEEELADVYYVLMGNLVSMGYDVPHYKKSDEMWYCSSPITNLMNNCGNIARIVRRRWDPFEESYVEQFTQLHISSVKSLYQIADEIGICNLKEAVDQKHASLINRNVKKIGETTVVSHWSTC